MGGLILIGILGSQDLWGWGEARGIGYMAFGIDRKMPIPKAM